MEVGSTSTATTKVQEAKADTTQKSDKASDTAWLKNAKEKVLDLSMSDDDLIKYIGDMFSGKGKNAADSEARRNQLQQLISLRAQIASAMSNIMKILSETSRSIINNIR
ncbi:MAG: hypothetical protein KBC84_11050 [Proteobacteria bacterium]|nr:hypothetical protein [Pseudomonadota bacterium]